MPAPIQHPRVTDDPRPNPVHSAFDATCNRTVAVVTFGDPDPRLFAAMRDTVQSNAEVFGAEVLTAFAGNGEWQDVDEHSGALLISMPTPYVHRFHAALRAIATYYRQDAIGWISPGNDRTLLYADAPEMSPPESYRGE